MSDTAARMAALEARIAHLEQSDKLRAERELHALLSHYGPKVSAFARQAFREGATREEVVGLVRDCGPNINGRWPRMWGS